MDIEQLKAYVKPIQLAQDMGMSLTTCPKNHESVSKTSFKVTDKYGMKCWNCGLSGNIIDMVKVFKQLSFKDSLEYLAKNYAPHLLNNTPEKNERDLVEELYKKLANLF